MLVAGAVGSAFSMLVAGAVGSAFSLLGVEGAGDVKGGHCGDADSAVSAPGVAGDGVGVHGAADDCADLEA